MFAAFHVAEDLGDPPPPIPVSSLATFPSTFLLVVRDLWSVDEHRSRKLIQHRCQQAQPTEHVAGTLVGHCHNLLSDATFALIQECLERTVLRVTCNGLGTRFRLVIAQRPLFQIPRERYAAFRDLRLQLREFLVVHVTGDLMRTFHINLSGVLVRSSFPDPEPFLAESLVLRNNTRCSGAFSFRLRATRAASPGKFDGWTSSIFSDGAVIGTGGDACPIGSAGSRIIRSLCRGGGIVARSMNIGCLK